MGLRRAGENTTSEEDGRSDAGQPIHSTLLH
jgi:hypothetical protein